MSSAVSLSSCTRTPPVSLHSIQVRYKLRHASPAVGGAARQSWRLAVMDGTPLPPSPHRPDPYLRLWHTAADDAAGTQACQHAAVPTDCAHHSTHPACLRLGLPHVPQLGYLQQPGSSSHRLLCLRHVRLLHPEAQQLVCCSSPSQLPGLGLGQWRPTRAGVTASPSAWAGVRGTTAASWRCSPHADWAQHAAPRRAACRLMLVAGRLDSGCALAQLHPKPLCRCSSHLVSMHSKGQLGDQDTCLQIHAKQRQAKCSSNPAEAIGASLPHQAPYMCAVMQLQC